VFRTVQVPEGKIPTWDISVTYPTDRCTSTEWNGYQTSAYCTEYVNDSDVKIINMPGV
jgi:hypothetical protein